VRFAKFVKEDLFFFPSNGGGILVQIISNQNKNIRKLTTKLSLPKKASSLAAIYDSAVSSNPKLDAILILILYSTASLL
jgi:hypothetical protein